MFRGHPNEPTKNKLFCSALKILYRIFILTDISFLWSLVWIQLSQISGPVLIAMYFLVPCQRLFENTVQSAFSLGDLWVLSLFWSVPTRHLINAARSFSQLFACRWAQSGDASKVFCDIQTIGAAQLYSEAISQLKDGLSFQARAHFYRFSALTDIDRQPPPLLPFKRGWLNFAGGQFSPICERKVGNLRFFVYGNVRGFLIYFQIIWGSGRMGENQHFRWSKIPKISKFRSPNR